MGFFSLIFKQRCVADFVVVRSAPHVHAQQFLSWACWVERPGSLQSLRPWTERGLIKLGPIGPPHSRKEVSGVRLSHNPAQKLFSSQTSSMTLLATIQCFLPGSGENRELSYTGDLHTPSPMGPGSRLRRYLLFHEQLLSKSMVNIVDSFPSAGEMAQWVGSLLCEPGDLSSHSQAWVKLSVGGHICNPSVPTTKGRRGRGVSGALGAS